MDNVEENSKLENQTEIEIEEVTDSSQQQNELSKDEVPAMEEPHADDVQEEWELHPCLPSEEDLLYPGQDLLELEAEFLDDEKQEDSLWQARTGLNFDTLCGAIETIIFMSDKPVPISKIKSLIDEDMPLRVIHQSLMRLQEEYESRHHGLRLVEVAEGYQYRTKATYSKYVQDLFKVNSLVLSPTALEVLAIIAYKQPVAKTEVDKIRGVDSGHIVRGLIDKRLVKVCGRSDEMGRPVLYGTTPEFLEVFNLANIDELPPQHELEESIENNVGKISDIKTIVHDGDKAQFVFDDMEELEGLASSIKEIAADTDFTSALKNQEKNKAKMAKAAAAEDAGTDEGSGASQEVEGPRTAFDILEEYVSKQLIINVNNESLVSEMMSMSADPIVISDLTAGPFNVPEDIEEEEEEFQMIDLDTGLPIEDDFEFEIEVELSDDLEGSEQEEADEQERVEPLSLDSQSFEGEDDSESEYIQGEDLIGDSDTEAEELARALDDAFERLTGESLDQADKETTNPVEQDELGLRDSTLEDKETDLDELAKDISEKAKDLDIDLDFLNDFSQE